MGVKREPGPHQVNPVPQLAPQILDELGCTFPLTGCVSRANSDPARTLVSHLLAGFPEEDAATFSLGAQICAALAHVGQCLLLGRMNSHAPAANGH